MPSALSRRATIGVPQVLSPSDANHYREIFRLQVEGRWSLADKHILAVRDKLLMGHVLHQRYMHPTQFRATFEQLRDWMAQYRDHPDATRVYELAIRRKPKKAADPVAPSSGLVAMVRVAAPPGPDPLTEKAALLNTKLAELLDKGQLSQCEQLLAESATQELLPVAAFDKVRSDLAMNLYLQGNDAQAYEIAAAGAERSSDILPANDWIAGLAAYRMGQLETAAFHFGRHANSAAAGPWNVSAGAYWAARTHLQMRQPARVERWLRLAAEHPRTFYGQIGRRALGLDSPLDWSQPAITQEDLDRVFKLPGGRRAVALVQLGEVVMAEEELRSHVWKLDDAHARSLLAVADAAGLPNTAVRAGSRLAQFGADAGDRVLYPELPWTPRNGFKLDRALIYAFARQESVFYSRATSPVGAVGLMQLMPETAMQVSTEVDLPMRPQEALYEPALNLALGQQYLAWLMARPDVKGNLFKIAIAYNAGIGNLRKWEKSVRFDDDPLLFIESIPMRETRIYVERVLANFWIYRERLGQPNPALDAVVAGEWPAYVPFDRTEALIAEDVPN